MGAETVSAPAGKTKARIEKHSRNRFSQGTFLVGILLLTSLPCFVEDAALQRHRTDGTSAALSRPVTSLRRRPNSGSKRTRLPPCY